MTHLTLCLINYSLVISLLLIDMFACIHISWSPSCFCRFYSTGQVDCAAVALISADSTGPQKPVRQKKDLVPTTGWTQGGIRDKYRSHAAPCTVELWVASTARQQTKVEVVSVFARAGQVCILANECIVQ